MAEGQFVSYLRVSTDRQGRSGLGLEAQRRAVEDFLNGGQWELVAEFQEVESGKKDDRPELVKALAICRLHRATLVIAKLDRLSRDAHFLLGLKKAGVKFLAADMPEANEMMVGIMAVVAQAERKMISVRTREALARKRAWYNRNRSELVKNNQRWCLGNPGNLKNEELGRARSQATRIAAAEARARDVLPLIKELQAAGATTLRKIAARLNERDIPATRGGQWSAVQVKRILDRL